MEECPLGNDGPRVAATGSNVGRARSRIALIVLVTSESPIVTTKRNTAIHRLGTRIHSITPATTPITITPWVEANSEMSSRIRRVDRPDVMVGAVRGERVKVCQRLAVAYQHRECRHHDARDDDGHECDRQRETGEDLGVEPTAHEPAKDVGMFPQLGVHDGRRNSAPQSAGGGSREYPRGNSGGA